MVNISPINSQSTEDACHLVVLSTWVASSALLHAGTMLGRMILEAMRSPPKMVVNGLLKNQGSM